MLVTSIFSILLLTPAILGTPIFESGAAESFASAAGGGGNAVSTASAVSGAASPSSSATVTATASVSSSSTLSGAPALSLTPAHYGSLHTVPVVENVQTVQLVPVVQNYQTIQNVPVVQQQLPAYAYGGGFAGSAGGFGLARSAIGGAGLGGGFRRYRESYLFKNRGFGGGLNRFGHLGFGGGRFKALYFSGGVAAGGFAGI